jgi:hypothetical protein
MEKECCQVKFIETDNGFKIEVVGKTMKEMMSACCIPIACCAPKTSSECCPPSKA